MFSSFERVQSCGGWHVRRMAYLKKIQRDIAVCALLLCPHCQQASRFTLQQVNGSIVLFGLPLLDISRVYQLVCSSCSFRKDLEPRELFAALRAKRLLGKVEAKKIEPEQYLRALDALNFPALRELQNGAKTWNCPGCAEKVPDNFNNCWKCGEPRSVGQADASDMKSPQLPHAFTQAPNPWER